MIPSFSGSGAGGGGSAADDSLEDNKIPPKSDWETDPDYWNKRQNKDKAQEEPDSTSEENKESTSPLQTDIDFSYELDDNGNPTLLVPNSGLAAERRPFSKVEFDQTASHMHHAPELGIELPKDFDMARYRGLDRAARTEYAKQKLPQEIIINYQNEIGKSICPAFGERLRSVPGHSGVRKREVELKIQSIGPDAHILSIVREDGMHVSSFIVDDDKLIKIAEDDFWVLKDRNI